MTAERLIMNENITPEQIAEARDWAADCLGMSAGVKPSAERAVQYAKVNYPGGWDAFVAEAFAKNTDLRSWERELLASPQERYEVALTRDGSTDRVDTFTWGATRQQAYNRAVELIEDPAYDGWSFSVAQEPTPAPQLRLTHVEFGTA